MISLTSVSVTHRTAAGVVHSLNDVNLAVETGEYVAVLGASGSGKTTLLNVIGGLIQPSAGDVEVAGKTITSLSENDRANLRLRSIGVVFQDNNLIAEFTALENVILPLSARGWHQSDAIAEAQRLLERFDIGPLANRKPFELSGGQRQRVGIARGLAGGRNILLADEPTGSLDTANSRAVFTLLGEVAAQGVAVVVATHDPNIERFASRVVSMRDGQIVADTRAARA